MLYHNISLLKYCFYWTLECTKPYLIDWVGLLQEEEASHLVGAEEVRSGQSPASLVAKEILETGSFEEVAAFHRFHQLSVEPEAGPAYLEEGEGEPVRQRKAEVWKVPEACCSEVVEGARKVLC